ncbi:hypothetical protein MPSEU_000262300 [Mayamaea pseudoterrestris]|nr:hypothetical protein MPSEU_000262300 [Mayamaea pseudoterrestris]
MQTVIMVMKLIFALSLMLPAILSIGLLLQQISTFQDEQMFAMDASSSFHQAAIQAAAEKSLFFTLQSSLSSTSSSSSFIPLKDLLNTYNESSCPEHLFLMTDDFHNLTAEYIYSRIIPRIIHVTGKSRCVSEPFRNNINTHWRNSYTDHAFVYYNDDAVNRLLQKHWPAFPHLQQVLQCLQGGAAKADLFRALVLWEYGGIYTDMDNAATGFNASYTISPDDQAFFVIEQGKFLSQFFMASKPKHPLMFLLVQHILHRLLSLNQVDKQYVPYVTGPGALKAAYIHYMNAQGPNEPNKKGHSSRYHNPNEEGVFVGALDNSTVTVRGNNTESTKYIERNVIRRKNVAYAAMNMTHYSDEIKPQVNLDSCMNRIYLRQVLQRDSEEGYKRLLLQQQW